jgi:hypothetical protein
MNEIRIRESREPLPGEVVQTFTWKNPKPPKPVKDPALKFQREQERLDRDPALFKSRATFAGL